MKEPLPTKRRDPAIAHAQAVVHQEERGDYFRTTRSGVTTKLADIRTHDHGKQELAHRIVHHAQAVQNPNSVRDAVEAEHEIEHIHEHRTLLSGCTR